MAAVHCASLVTDRLCLRMKDMTDSACKPILASGTNSMGGIALGFEAHIVAAVGAEGSCRGT